MTDKRTTIIKTAIQLFAEKGFHSTSIQEIADAAGIAKGSMYLYFKSKDDLLLSIYGYYQRAFENIFNEGHEGLSRKDRFRVQVRAQLETFVSSRDFIKMQMREPYIHQNGEVKKTAMRLRLRGMVWLYDQVLELYGEAIRPWALDLTNMFQAVIGGYMSAMVIQNTVYDMQELSGFLVGRLDDLAAGLIQEAPQPILRDKEWEEILTTYGPGCSSSPSYLQELFRQLREAAGALPREGGAAEDFTGSLQMLEDELQKPKPNRVIVQGMLAYLMQAGQPGLKKLLKQLQASAAAVMENAGEGQS